MIREFDLNIGDTVWFMWKNKPTEGRICKIWSNTFISPVDCDSIVESVWYYIIIDKKACEEDGRTGYRSPFYLRNHH